MLNKKIAVIGITGLLLGACTHTDKEAGQSFGSTAEISSQITKLVEGDRIADKPGKFVGNTVSFKGEVTEILTEHAFKVDVDGPLGGDELLIVNDCGVPIPLKNGDDIMVTGPVRLFVAAEIEKEIEDKLVESIFVSYENTPVVVAKQVTGMWDETR